MTPQQALDLLDRWYQVSTAAGATGADHLTVQQALALLRLHLAAKEARDDRHDPAAAPAE